MQRTPESIPAGHKSNRGRWAAIGAAVAVSLGAGGFGIANADVLADPQNVYVAISPCRLADTRPGTDNIGPRATPLGANDTWTLLGTGDVAGPCNLPSGVSALELNVTALNASALTFLTLYPSDVTRPLASNLNPSPGQPPTPNSVTVTLPASGNFDVYNLAGSVDVIIDVVGYYDDHSHTSADITNEPGVSYNFKSATTPLGANTVVTNTLIRVPSDGFLVMEATGNYSSSGGAFDQAVCQLTLGSAEIDFNQAHAFVATETSNYTQSVSLHRTVPVSAANNPFAFNSGQNVRLVCTNSQGTGTMNTVMLTATFYPTEFEPSGLVFQSVDAEAVDGNADQG